MLVYNNIWNDMYYEIRHSANSINYKKHNLKNETVKSWAKNNWWFKKVPDINYVKQLRYFLISPVTIKLALQNYHLNLAENKISSAKHVGLAPGQWAKPKIDQFYGEYWVYIRLIPTNWSTLHEVMIYCTSRTRSLVMMLF